MLQQVFVYGTLLPGESHHRLLRDAERLGPHRTRPCFTMYDLGGCPGVVRDGQTAVAGEVYRLPERALARLDRLEEYPHRYRRELIPTDYGRAWIYLYCGPRGAGSIIPGGCWLER